MKAKTLIIAIASAAVGFSTGFIYNDDPTVLEDFDIVNGSVIHSDDIEGIVEELRDIRHDVKFLERRRELVEELDQAIGRLVRRLDAIERIMPLFIAD